MHNGAGWQSVDRNWQFFGAKIRARLQNQARQLFFLSSRQAKACKLTVSMEISYVQAH